jgi:hypothetical protein
MGNVWRWLLGLFGGGREKPSAPPATPYVIELHQHTYSPRQRQFIVRLAGLPWEVAVFASRRVELDRPSSRYTLSVRRFSDQHHWLVTVEYVRPRYAEPDPAPPGEPLTTDALRSLCAGAGTDGAVVFTSEGGWRRAQ